MTGDVVFYLFAALAVVSAFFVVFTRNIVHAGFSLLFTLFGVAGLYGILGADFLAVAQVIVYIGGVLVLVLFTVMMTRTPRHKRRRVGLDLHVPAGIFALAVFGVLYRLITGVDWSAATPAAPRATIAEIGTNFMTNYIFPFEYVSIVLLVAMIGAAILIRERAPRAEERGGLATEDAPVGGDPTASGGAAPNETPGEMPDKERDSAAGDSDREEVRA